MIGKSAMWMILAALAVGGISETAVAGQGLYFSGYYGGSYPGAYPLRSYYVQRMPPYFAMFPPVYYSSPVRRPYGLSPYAWPPIYHGAAVRDVLDRGASDYPSAKPVKRPTPIRIRNPYVSQAAEPSAIPIQTGVRTSLRISNPYVERGGDSAAPN